MGASQLLPISLGVHLHRGVICPDRKSRLTPTGVPPCHAIAIACRRA